MKVRLTDSNNMELFGKLNKTDDTPCVMGIDASTTNTGITILTLTGELKLIGRFTREPMRESPVRYKILLKEQIYQLLKNYRNITAVIYEEPCVAFVSAVKNLYMLRSMVEEVLIEHEADLPHIEYIEVPNARWKKIFLAPQKTPVGTELAKRAISDKVQSEQPQLKDLTQDEKDAYGIAASYVKLKDKNDIKPKRVSREFAYLTSVHGLNTADIPYNDVSVLASESGVPKQVLANGIELIPMKGRKDFDKEIRNHMQADDKLLAFIYPSNLVGSLALKYKMGNLLNTSTHILILVWRKNRKRKPQYTI